MKPRDVMLPRAVVRRFAAIAIALTTLVLRAATPPVSQEKPIELPPMIVADVTKSPPWLHASIDGTEYLSRCSVATTNSFATAQGYIHALLREFVPDEFLARSAAPTTSLLMPLAAKTASDDAVRQEILRSEQEDVRRKAETARQKGELPTSSRLLFLPNHRIEDRDTAAVFTYIDESSFDADRMVVATDYVHSLLVRRQPMLPQWFIEGVAGLHLDASFRVDPITLPPFTWISAAETAALVRDPELRRPLLTAGELFAPDAALGPANTHPLRVAVWRSQVRLFVRWAMDPSHAPARENLWQLVRRASEQPLTEAMFTECFGFGYSDLRDRLSDYLPVAVKSPIRITPRKLPPAPRVEVRTATPAQVARLRGEWERLEISFVRERHPPFIDKYVEQARNTLRRAVGSGLREPPLLASLGLCEIDAGDPDAGRPWLEAAVDAGVVRPRVYYEVARLRWEALLRDAPPTRRFSVAELEPVLGPLRRGLQQAPLLPETVMLLQDAWLRSQEPTPPPDLPFLIDVARRFRRYPGVGFRLAMLHALHGQRAEAIDVLRTAGSFVTDRDTRAHYRSLLERLIASQK